MNPMFPKTENRWFENCKLDSDDVLFFNIKCVSMNRLELEDYEPLEGLNGKPRVSSDLYSSCLQYNIRDVSGTCDNADCGIWVESLLENGLKHGIGHLVEIIHPKKGNVDYIECALVPRYGQFIEYNVFKDRAQITYTVDEIYGASPFHNPGIWK